MIIFLCILASARSHSTIALDPLDRPLIPTFASSPRRFRHLSVLARHSVLVTFLTRLAAIVLPKHLMPKYPMTGTTARRVEADQLPTLLDHLQHECHMPKYPSTQTLGETPLVHHESSIRDVQREWKPKKLHIRG